MVLRWVGAQLGLTNDTWICEVSVESPDNGYDQNQGYRYQEDDYYDDYYEDYEYGYDEEQAFECSKDGRVKSV